jgi:hypothetical protein
MLTHLRNTCKKYPGRFDKADKSQSKFFFFFDMSAQEEEAGFELVTSDSLGVVPAD